MGATPGRAGSAALRVAGACLAVFLSGPSIGFADIQLSMSPGTGPGEVRLDWTGGQPGYYVFRATMGSSVTDAAHRIGDTQANSFVDVAPADDLLFYRVLGPCSVEDCNDLDDDCDGIVDNGAFQDALEPDDSCAAVRTLATVGSDQTISLTSATIYGYGDQDYYRIRSVESDSSCSCCDLFCTDEDFRLRITLSVPSGAGSYIFCTGSSCAGVDENCQEVLAGNSGTWTWTLDGDCTGTPDEYDHYVHILGDNSPALECLPYMLVYALETGCF